MVLVDKGNFEMQSRRFRFPKNPSKLRDDGHITRRYRLNPRDVSVNYLVYAEKPA